MDSFYDSSFNLISLTIEDHIKAHQLLNNIYNNERDRGAVLMLSGRTPEAERIWRQLGARATNALMREQKRTVFDPEWQRIMGLRSMQRPDALKIRSEGGKKGGFNTKKDIAIKLHQRFVFSYEGKEFLCIFKCQTDGQVCKLLNEAIPTKIKRVTPLLDGSRSMAYGWSCKEIK